MTNPISQGTNCAHGQTRPHRLSDWLLVVRLGDESDAEPGADCTAGSEPIRAPRCAGEDLAGSGFGSGCRSSSTTGAVRR